MVDMYQRFRRQYFKVVPMLCCASIVILYIVTDETSKLTAKRNIVKVHRYPANTDGYDVILSSYMRSGSSLLGEILGHRKDVFYFYEPLWRVRNFQYYKDADWVCDYKTPQCLNLTEIDTQPNLFERLWKPIKYRNEIRLSVALDYLQSIFNCDFYNYPEFIQDHIHSDVTLSGNDWIIFKQCMAAGINRRDCLQQQAAICNPARHRVTKVLRMSPYNMAELLRLNERLKIVHLFRDPRSIINSHLNTEFYHLNDTVMVDIIKDVNALCSRLQHDVLTLKTLIRKYPNRVKVVRYEDFTRTNFSIEVINDLYNFLGYSNTEENRKDIECKICSNNDCCGKKSLHSSPDYRDSLNFDIIKYIDDQCYDAYRALGYVAFYSLKDLHNATITSHTKRHGMHD